MSKGDRHPERDAEERTSCDPGEFNAPRKNRYGDDVATWHVRYFTRAGSVIYYNVEVRGALSGCHYLGRSGEEARRSIRKWWEASTSADAIELRTRFGAWPGHKNIRLVYEEIG